MPFPALPPLQARGSLQATLNSLIGGVGSEAETSGAIPPGWPLPVPLPWTGASDYNNAINAPQVVTDSSNG